MIFEVKFDSGQIDDCTAKDVLHLLQSYDEEYEFDLQSVDSVTELTPEQAKNISVRNTDYEEGSDMPKMLLLWDLGTTDEDFKIIASTEF